MKNPVILPPYSPHNPRNLGERYGKGNQDKQPRVFIDGNILHIKNLYPIEEFV